MKKDDIPTFVWHGDHCPAERLGLKGGIESCIYMRGDSCAKCALLTEE